MSVFQWLAHGHYSNLLHVLPSWTIYCFRINYLLGCGLFGCNQNSVFSCIGSWSLRLFTAFLNLVFRVIRGHPNLIYCHHDIQHAFLINAFQSAFNSSLPSFSSFFHALTYPDPSGHTLFSCLVCWLTFYKLYKIHSVFLNCISPKLSSFFFIMVNNFLHLYCIFIVAFWGQFPRSDQISNIWEATLKLPAHVFFF